MFLVVFFHLVVAIIALTSSGLSMLHCCARFVSLRIAVCMVSSAFPFFLRWNA